jgi:hypothetical protein
LDGHISVKTADYKGREMAEADKVGLETFGLGTSAKGHRVIVTFPRYLASMSSRHQQHWDTYRVHGKSRMERNYALRGILGQWTDGVSVYDALLAEIFHINQMCQLIGLPNLFRRDYSRETRGGEDSSPLDEPKGFGLLMVPTKKHFLEFAQSSRLSEKCESCGRALLTNSLTTNSRLNISKRKRNSLQKCIVRSQISECFSKPIPKRRAINFPTISSRNI